jgi:hypothetical protein
MGGLPRHIPSPAQAQPRGIPLGSGSGTSATRDVICNMRASYCLILSNLFMNFRGDRECILEIGFLYC